MTCKEISYLQILETIRNKVDIYIIDFGTKTFWINHLNHIEDIDIKSDRQAYQNQFILWLDIQSIFIHQFWFVFVCWKNVKQQKLTHWYVILTLVYQIDWIFYKRITSIPFTMSYAKKLCHWLFIYYLSFFIQIRVSNRFEQDMYTFCYKMYTIQWAIWSKKCIT